MSFATSQIDWRDYHRTDNLLTRDRRVCGDPRRWGL